MHSDNQHSRVLCISRDPTLLKTRQMVFATCYDAVSVGSVDEMQRLPGLGAFNLLVVCHSLSINEFENAVAYARARWPDIKIIALTVGEANRVDLSDRRVRGLDGPRTLLRTMEGLLLA